MHKRLLSKAQGLERSVITEIDTQSLRLNTQHKYYSISVLLDCFYESHTAFNGKYLRQFKKKFLGHILQVIQHHLKKNCI